MRSNSRWLAITPQQRQNFLPSKKRILRSNANEDMLNSTLFHHREIFDGKRKQKFGAGRLNTNTNNSGPHDDESTWVSKIDGRDYQISTDEDGDLECQSQPTTSKFKIPMPTFRVSEKSIQTNTSGLSNDEGNVFHRELTGALSSDDQCDQDPLQTKSRHRKSSKSEFHKKRFDYIRCSPIGIMHFSTEYAYLLGLAICRLISLVWTILVDYSSCKRWFQLPFILPRAVIKSCIYWSAFSIDRIFGTSLARRWISSSRKQSLFFLLLRSTLWLLISVATSMILMHFVMGRLPAHLSTDLSILFENVSDSTYHFVDKACMEDNDCCHNTWEYGRRLFYCWLALPRRWLLSDIDQNPRSGYTSSMTLHASNSSNMHDILLEMQIRLNVQDEMITKFHLRMSEIENDFVKKTFGDKIHEKRQKELANENMALAMKIERFYDEFLLLQSMKESMLYYVKNISVSHEESVRSLKMDLEILRGKWENNMEIMQAMMGKSISNETTKEQSDLLFRIQHDVGQLSDRVNEVYIRTMSLEMDNNVFRNNSYSLKQEIREKMKNVLTILKIDQTKYAKKMNQQMSKVEEMLDKHYSKLFEKGYITKVIESHLGNLQSNITKEISSTMWENVKWRVRHMVEALHKQGSGTSKSSFYLRKHHNSCVFLSKVREMIAESLQLYSADKIGLADFALESAGGTILTTRCTETYTDRSATLSILGLPILRLTTSPKSIIQPNIHPGECWAMKGSKGSVVVKLFAQVRVTSVSIDHIPKSISPSGIIDSAIKDFEIKGLMNEEDTKGHSLDKFTFQIDGNSVQTFVLKEPITTNLVEMIVNSNYGNEEYTCIYRFRVHGRAVKL